MATTLIYWAFLLTEGWTNRPRRSEKQGAREGIALAWTFFHTSVKPYYYPLSLSLFRQFRVSSRHSLLSGAQYVAAANELR